MSAIFDVLKEIFKDALAGMDLKALLYDGLKNHILPSVKAAVAKSDNKIDDVMYQGLEHMVDAYLKPTPPTP